MSEELWPLAVREAAETVFGGSIHNVNGRTHKALDRRIRHALAVWRDRYQGLNAEQLEYAGRCLAWAIWRSENASEPYPYSLKMLEVMVNEPRVAEGMKRRSGFVQVDVEEMLRGVQPVEATRT